MYSRMMNFWPLTREPIESCTATKHQFVSSSAIKACETIAGTTESHRRIAIYYGGAQLSYIGERTNEGTFLPRPWSCSTRESYCPSEQSQGESQSALRNWSSGRRSHQGPLYRVQFPIWWMAQAKWNCFQAFQTTRSWTGLFFAVCPGLQHQEFAHSKQESGLSGTNPATVRHDSIPVARGEGEVPGKLPVWITVLLRHQWIIGRQMAPKDYQHQWRFFMSSLKLFAST